jgi:HlyD family secretion protein
MKDEQDKKRTSRVRLFLSLAVAVGLIAGGVLWWQTNSAAQAKSIYRTAPLERGTIQAVVSATGVVNPVNQVSVGTQISGQIKKLYVDFNDEVKAGQLIALIEPEVLEQKVRAAQADVQAAQANVHTAQAKLDSAKVDWEQARHDEKRKAALYDKRFIAFADWDKAQATVQTTQEAIQLNKALLEQAQTQVTQKQAVLVQARIDLSHTRITSPLTGIVIKRSVDTGQTVAASLQSPELFVIAKDLSDMQAEINVDESDVGRLQPGMKATFTVDAFPGEVFQGQISQIRRAPQSQSNVVSYVVLIRFRNEPERVFPGMTANARVLTAERVDALKVPNAALRVRLPQEVTSRPDKSDKSDKSGKMDKTDKTDKKEKGQGHHKNPAMGRLYVLDSGSDPQQPVAVPVKLGISDGSYTEVLGTVKPEQADRLKEGVSVLIGVTGSLGGSNKAGASTGPRLPF